VATPVALDSTTDVVITELATEPSAAVENEVYVLATVEEAYREDVTVVSPVRVDRLIVDDPTTTTSGVEELVTLVLVVTVDPALLVVVISTVVGVADVDSGSDVDASEV